MALRSLAMAQAHTQMQMGAGISGGFVYFTWSEDNGSTWKPQVLVSPELVADEQPAIAEAEQGAILIAVSMGGAVKVFRSERAGVAGSWFLVGTLE